MTSFAKIPDTSECFTFGNATMKLMAKLFVVLVPVIWLGAIILIGLWLFFWDWVFLVMGLGLAVLALLCEQQARQYRKTIGRKLQVDAQGLALPELGLLLPWEGIERITQRRDRPRSGSWRYIEFHAYPNREDLKEQFAQFNANVPSALGPFAFESAGFVIDMLSNPTSDHQRLVSAIQRFAPHLCVEDQTAVRC